jgi:hypothetical protein
MHPIHVVEQLSIIQMNSPPADNKIVDLLSWPDFKAIALPAFDAVLCPRGFERFGNSMSWVDSRHVPIRRMFLLAAWKGAAVAPQWGFSLDYVPHLSGKTFKWHRTAKSARPDLFMDAIAREMDLSTLWGAQSLRATLPLVVERSIPQAYLLWESVASITDLPNAFDRVMRHREESRQFTYANLVQPGLAYAFTLAKLGQLDVAGKMLEKYPLLRSLNAEQRDELDKLLASAAPK